MTNEQLRKEKGYIEAKEKILKYPIGFKFTVPLYQMPEAKRNAMRILLNDCCKEKIIKSINIGLDLGLNITEETCVRI